MTQPNNLLLIDGTALVYRMYFALIKRPLMNSKGENTSAVFGFTNTLLGLLNKQRPDYIAVVFDAEGPTFRHEMYKEYKELANALAELRPEVPTDRIRAVPLVVAIHGSRSREKGSAELWLPLLDRRALRDYSQACRERIQQKSEQLREFVYHVPLGVEKVSRDNLHDEYEYEEALDG